MTRKQQGTAKFIYNGAKDAFVKNVQEQIGLFNSEHKADFITEKKDGNVSIGLGRAGHGGGVWYEPTIVEEDDFIIIDGAINFVSWHDDDTKWWQSLIMWIGVIIPLCIVFSPVLLFRLIFSPFISTPKKQLRKYMIEYVKCTEVRKSKH